MSVEVSPEFDSTTWLEPFCVVSAFSPHACMGSGFFPQCE